MGFWSNDEKAMALLKIFELLISLWKSQSTSLSTSTCCLRNEHLIPKPKISKPLVFSNSPTRIFIRNDSIWNAAAVPSVKQKLRASSSTGGEREKEFLNHRNSYFWMHWKLEVCRDNINSCHRRFFYPSPYPPTIPAKTLVFLSTQIFLPAKELLYCVQPEISLKNACI